MVALTLVTPGRGTLSLSAESDPALFSLAKCGLGALGVVAEVTLQAVRIEPLAEQTVVMTRSQVVKGHGARLAANRHLRYMWLPHTDDVVVVTANPLAGCPPGTKATSLPPDSYRLAPLRALLRRCRPEVSESQLEGMSFADLRDAILSADPLSVRHVAAAAAAEAQFWRRSQGWRLGDNESILGFECGGEQARRLPPDPRGEGGCHTPLGREAFLFPLSRLRTLPRCFDSLASARRRRRSGSPRWRSPAAA